MRTIALTTKRFVKYDTALAALNAATFFRKGTMLICLMLLVQSIDGQSLDSSIVFQNSKQLPGITIRDARLEQTGYRVWKADSLPVNGPISLSSRLFWENTLDARTNAPGTLSTISIRGAGPSRTPVFWNGINLQSCMNGVVDVALIPIWSDDQLELRYGGQSAAQSSGAMGGSIVLAQGQQKFEQGFSGFLNGGIGSFGQLESNAGAGISGKKFTANIRGVWQQADNDFSYKKQGLDGRFYEAKQVNNFLRKTDLQQFSQWRINSRNTVKSAIWLQDAIRQLPPSSTESPRETWQMDRARRVLLNWQHAASPKSVWTTRAAWMDDFLAFYLSGDTDTSRSRQVLLSTEMANTSGNQWTFRTGASGIKQWAQVDGYSDSTKWFGQTRLAAFGLGAWQYQDTRISGLLRQEWAEAQAAPFTWSLAGEQKFGRVGELRFHLSRNFNLPTLNDRFWKNLGRPDLKPEKGYSADLGWSYSESDFSFELTGFQLILDDWILWQPDSNGLFRPANLRKVWSRGIELNGKWQTSQGPWKFGLESRMQYSKTTNLAVYGGNESVLGKQLPYTPKASGSFMVRVSRKNYGLAFVQQFTGARFDNGSIALKSFQVGNLLANYQFLNGHFKLSARLENIWNVQYEVIRYRPMPGRSWNLGLGYKW